MGIVQRGIRGTGLRTLPAISINNKQRLLWPSAISHLSHYSHPDVSPEGTQDGNKIPAIKLSASAATLLRCALRRLRMRKHRIGFYHQDGT